MPCFKKERIIMKTFKAVLIVVDVIVVGVLIGFFFGRSIISTMTTHGYRYESLNFRLPNGYAEDEKYAGSGKAYRNGSELSHLTIRTVSKRSLKRFISDDTIEGKIKDTEYYHKKTKKKDISRMRVMIKRKGKIYDIRMRTLYPESHDLTQDMEILVESTAEDDK